VAEAVFDTGPPDRRPVLRVHDNL